MKMYHGWRDANGTAHVNVELLPLDPRLDLANHSPTGFRWGYGGNGPALLAWRYSPMPSAATAWALPLRQPFKWRFVAKLPRHREWWISSLRVIHMAGELAQADLLMEVPLNRLGRT